MKRKKAKGQSLFKKNCPAHLLTCIRPLSAILANNSSKALMTYLSIVQKHF